MSVICGLSVDNPSFKASERRSRKGSMTYPETHPQCGLRRVRVVPVRQSQRRIVCRPAQDALEVIQIHPVPAEEVKLLTLR